MTPTKFLNLKDASRYTGFSVRALRGLCKDRKIPYTRPTNGMIFFQIEDLTEFMNSGRIESTEVINQFAASHN